MMGNVTHILRRIEKCLLLIGLATVVVLVVLQVVFRYMLKGLAGMGWTEELTRIILIWVVLLGALYLQREGGQLKVELVSKALGHGKRRVLGIFSDLVVLVTSAILLYSALLVSKQSLQIVTPVLHWPRIVYYGVLAAVLGLMISETLVRLVVSLRQFSRPPESSNKEYAKPQDG